MKIELICTNAVTSDKLTKIFKHILYYIITYQK